MRKITVVVWVVQFSAFKYNSHERMTFKLLRIMNHKSHFYFPPASFLCVHNNAERRSLRDAFNIMLFVEVTPQKMIVCSN